MRCRVSHRIDGNKQRLNGLAGRTERVERKRHRLQLSGADVRTMGIAEINQEELAAEIRVSAAPPAVIGEIEWPANRLAPSSNAWMSAAGGALAASSARAGTNAPSSIHVRARVALTRRRRDQVLSSARADCRASCPRQFIIPR